MNCPNCKRKLAEVYPTGTYIGKDRFGKEIGYSCLKCKRKYNLKMERVL